EMARGIRPPPGDPMTISTELSRITSVGAIVVTRVTHAGPLGRSSSARIIEEEAVDRDAASKRVAIGDRYRDSVSVSINHGDVRRLPTGRALVTRLRGRDRGRLTVRGKGRTSRRRRKRIESPCVHSRNTCGCPASTDLGFALRYKLARDNAASWHRLPSRIAITAIRHLSHAQRRREKIECARVAIGQPSSRCRSWIEQLDGFKNLHAAFRWRSRKQD